MSDIAEKIRDLKSKRQAVKDRRDGEIAQIDSQLEALQTSLIEALELLGGGRSVDVPQRLAPAR